MDGTQGFDMDLPSHRLTWLPTLLSAQFLNGRNPNMSPFPRRPTSPWITEGLQWIFSIRDWASICPYGNNHIFWNGFASPGAFTRTIILGFSNYFIHFVHLWIILYNISSGQETHFTVRGVTKNPYPWYSPLHTVSYRSRQPDGNLKLPVDGAILVCYTSFQMVYGIFIKLKIIYSYVLKS